MQHNEHATMLGIRVSALVEMAVVFILLLLIDIFMMDGNRFWEVQPHPFWIVILPIAAHYGTNAGLLAALIATALYLIGNMPVRLEAQDTFDYFWMVARNPIMWIVVSIFVGEIRQRHIRERNTLRHELEDSTEREEKISESYQAVRSRKEKLEVQVAGQLTSSVEAFRAAKSMEARDPRMILDGVERLVTAVLHPEKFSLFLLQNDKIEATLTHGWSSEDAFAKSFDAYNGLYSEIVGSHKTLCIANEQDEALLAGEGMLAGPVRDPETGVMIGMLKIEKIDFVNLSLSTVETFKAVCEWVGASVVFARNYQSVKEESVVNPDHNLMTYNFFRRQSDYLTSLSKRVGCDLHMVVVKTVDPHRFSTEERVKIANELSGAVKKVLRQVDLAFDYQETGEEYSLLLPATDREGANIVKEKIAKELDNRISMIGDTGFTYLVHTLHEAA